MMPAMVEEIIVAPKPTAEDWKPISVSASLPLKQSTINDADNGWIKPKPKPANTRSAVCPSSIGTNIGRKPPMKHNNVPMIHRFFLPIFVAKRPPISVAMMLPSTGTVTKHCSSMAEALGKSCLRLDTTAAVTEMLCSSRARDKIAPLSMTRFGPDCGSCDIGAALAVTVVSLIVRSFAISLYAHCSRALCRLSATTCGCDFSLREHISTI